MSGKNYEEEFALEMIKVNTGKNKTTPWGSGYAVAPEILHGERWCGSLIWQLACTAWEYAGARVLGMCSWRCSPSCLLPFSMSVLPLCSSYSAAQLLFNTPC